MSALTKMTGQTEAYLKARVNKAYLAAFNKKAPAMTFTSPVEDPEVKGRIHFNVNVDGRVLGKASYKPKRQSVFVAWGW